MLATLLLGLILLLDCGDNDVQWNGISHVPWQDRRPLCPVDRESFAVFVQTYRFDVCRVLVHVQDGSQQLQIEAVFDHDRGPYAVWRAQLPSATGPVLRYYFEFVDGTDRDYYSVGGMSDDQPGDGGFVLDFDTLSHAPLGATPVRGGVVFKVWAPTPSRAWVRGQFNNWGTSHEMSRQGEHFVARVPGARPRQKYKYYFSPNLWKPDARSRAVDGGDNYNSIIEEPLGYTWNSGHFATPPFEDLVLYELHVGTFAGRNDDKASGRIPATYRDVAAHAEHLAELGVNAVQLMPINEFPWDFSAGYNPISMWQMELKYGTYDDLKHMIDVLHGHGIAVLMDIVWNHVGPVDNYLWYYDGGQIYFRTPNLDTQWGPQANFERGPVREYYQNSALYLLEEFRIDGFRMDGTDYMNIPPQEGAGWSLMQWFNDTLDNRFIDKIAIAEQLPNDPWVTRPTRLGGAGFDSQWHDAFTDNVRQALLDAAFGDPRMWTVRDAILGGGEYLSGRYVVNYLESHDEIWPETGGQRIVKTIDPTFPHDDKWAKGRSKLGHGLPFVAPGIPMIHQGNEWLEDEDFGGGNPQGGNRIDWSKKTRYAAIYRYYKDLIAIRRSNGALRADAPVDVYHVNESGNVLAFHRWDYRGNVIIVVANFSNTDYPSYWLGFPQPGPWYELINSQDARYDGNGLVNRGAIQTAGGPMHGFAQSAEIRVPQMGLLVFRWNDPPGRRCGEDIDGDGSVGLPDLAALLASFDRCRGEQGFNPDADVNGNGCVDLADLAAVLGLYGQPCP